MAASTAMHKVLGPSWMRPARVGLLVPTLMAAGVLACGGDTTGPGPLTPAQAYWTLDLNYHAVTFALAGSPDTLQLIATPRNVFGQPLTGIGPVQFKSTDSTVSVDATGKLTAKYVTSATTTVIASVTDTVHHLTLADTCYIQVKGTTPASPLTTYTIQPDVDTLMPIDQTYTMMVTATDANGQPVPAFSYFKSTNPNIASINPLTGLISGKRIGQVQLSGEMWAYGVARRDSLTLTVDAALAAAIEVLPVTPTGSTHPTLTFWPQIVTVSTGAVVTWRNLSLTDSIDVVFDDPTNVDSAKYQNFLLNFSTGGGNIAPWRQDTTASDSISARICKALFGHPPKCNNAFFRSFAPKRLRSFPVAGTYHYHSTIWGSTGTIIVQ